MTAGRTHVEWRGWGAAPFEEARSADRPVLLSLTATWCDSCHEMDGETYAEPRIAANVNDGFVPVRVDVDRRPRIRERYNMGGFPSTVFCTPDGDVITGAGYLGPDGMRQVLDSVREVWADRGDDAGRVPRALAGDPTPGGTVDERIEEHLAGQLDEQWDDRFGGWGDDAKFPLPQTVEFALKRDRPKATQTLRAIAESLIDHDAGGFYRYAAARDWSEPEREKLLTDNAALIRAFANGYLYTGEESLLNPATGAQEFLTDRLWNGAAFGGSVAPPDDDSEPRRDHTGYAGGNALAAEALLTVAAYTDDEASREYAERVLRTLEESFVDDGVVSHIAPSDVGADDPDPPAGLLEDHARVIAAFATARQVLGPDALPVDPLTVAGTVADEAIETLQEPAGAFRDGPPQGVGLVSEPLRPLDGTVEVADALVDLAAVADVVDDPEADSDGHRSDDYAAAAHDAVAAFAGAWDRFGVQVAGYGSVASRLTRPNLVVAVGDGAGSDLHRAGLRVADHEAVVVPAAPNTPEGVATIHRGADRRDATAPEELLDAVAALTDG
ncbi:hypothetical protein GCM10008995_17310 [Halobellus salinus]|uniref:Thioredoxin domain-containing protein n=1 Tax=Halobellus salinus TaxID=931585 RepID=A0A830ETE2_9EURY|nr:DUF255 domain-containing protein [Halobellus salinus]GGJ07899.1 hypothetical protein GCM10008995_17310 [Halobellus salinus]SMP27836.1 hypothetical protein SAMN06265347_1133 [Halobellus salinus]